MGLCQVCAASHYTHDHARVVSRERIATAVLAGFSTVGGAGLIQFYDGPTAALLAVKWADALIAELDK